MSETGKEYLELFQEIFDPGRTGYFTLQEVEVILVASGFIEEKANVLTLLRYLEPDETGKVLVEDVEALFHPDFVKLDDKANIQDMFEHFDRNEDNLISAEDLLEASGQMGVPLTMNQAQLMIKTFDSDQDGQVTYEEFSEIFVELNKNGIP